MAFYTPPSSTYETHREVLLSSPAGNVIGTYTVDGDYITEVTRADGQTSKILYEGQVMAMNPANGQAVPNYSAYGFGVLGPLWHSVCADDSDPLGNIILHGWVNELACTDNGVFGTVLAATKSALTHVVFVARETL